MIRIHLLFLLTGWLALTCADCRAAGDSATADEAILKSANIPTDDSGLLEFFRKRTLADPDGEKIHELIVQLGDDSFEMREKASARLVTLGTMAVPLLRQAVNDPDIEVVRRAEKCLEMIKAGSGAAAPAAAARLLARRQPAGAAEVLLGYLPFAENEMVAEEVRTALAAVAVHDGKVEPALTAALTDKVALRRAAAAETLWKIGSPEQRPEVRKLLKDPDPAVRLRIGLLLADARDKDAVPVLIDLLGSVPQPQGWQVTDFLSRLADEQAPSIPPGNDDSSRQGCKTAWSAWWEKHGPTLDMAILDKGPRLLGYHLIVLLDRGAVMELDAAGKPRWQIEGLQKPLDVQWLPGDHLLVAEQEINRVSERSSKGDIVWEKRIDGPLVAQRLPNGNTFIANANELLEVDKTGKETFTHSFISGENIMRAQKLANGDIACVTSGHRYVRLDASGKEVQSFPVAVRTSGGRIDVLSNGRVIVPLMSDNKVVEYDPQGNAIWEAAVEQPIAAVRLPNGHTLVTSMTQNRAVELDRAGHEVWEYRSDTRVTRAYRR